MLKLIKSITKSAIHNATRILVLLMFVMAFLYLYNQDWNTINEPIDHVRTVLENIIIVCFALSAGALLIEYDNHVKSGSKNQF